MSKRRLEQLRKMVQLKCFRCGRNIAEHILHLDWECLDFRVCLCDECIQLDNDTLIEELLNDKRSWQKAA